MPPPAWHAHVGWVHLSLFIVALLYAGTFSVAKVAMPAYVGPLGYIALRVACSTVLLWALWFVNGRQRFDFKVDGPLLVACTLTGVVVNMELFFAGLSLTSPIHGAVIMVTTPIFVALISVALRRERATWVRSLGILLGAAGAVFLVSQGKAGGNGDALGDLMVMGNAIIYASFLVIARPLMHKYKPLTVTTWMFTLANLITLPLGWTQLNGLVASGLDGGVPSGVWWSLAYVVAGSTFLTYVLNAYALSRVSATIVGAYIYLQPVLAAAIALVAGTDALSALVVGCSAVIFVGVYLAGRPAGKPRALPE